MSARFRTDIEHANPGGVKAMAKARFKGSFTALVTPFRDGALDEKAFRDFVNWQIDEGTHGLVPVGTTGREPDPEP